jgi:putative transposase
VYQRWKRQFNAGGASLLKPQYLKVDPELRALQEENTRLKKIIGNQALEFKSELLKKRCPREEAQGLGGFTSKGE